MSQLWKYFQSQPDGDDDDGGCDDDNDDNDDDGGSEIYLCNHFGSFPKRTSPAFPFSASLGAINTAGRMVNQSCKKRCQLYQPDGPNIFQPARKLGHFVIFSDDTVLIFILHVLLKLKTWSLKLCKFFKAYFKINCFSLTYQPEYL